MPYSRKSKSKSKSVSISTARKILTSKPKRRMLQYARNNKAPRSKAMGRMFPNFFGQGPFPPTKNYKLQYSQSFNTSYTVGTTGTFGAIQKFNLNSLYDPDETGGGHQPYGYDALSIAYNRYKVNGAKVEITVYDPSADGIIVGYMLTNSSNSSETIAGLFVDSVVERQNVGKIILNNSGSQLYKRTAYIPMWQAGGLTKLEFMADPDNFTAGVGGNPGNKIQLQFAAADSNGGSTATIHVAVKITYYATLFMRKVMSGS